MQAAVYQNYQLSGIVVYFKFFLLWYYFEFAKLVVWDICISIITFALVLLKSVLINIEYGKNESRYPRMLRSLRGLYNIITIMLM